MAKAKKQTVDEAIEAAKARALLEEPMRKPELAFSQYVAFNQGFKVAFENWMKAIVGAGIIDSPLNAALLMRAMREDIDDFLYLMVGENGMDVKHYVESVMWGEVESDDPTIYYSLGLTPPKGLEAIS